MRRPMATPRRIYRIYEKLAANAGEIREFVAAKGEKSGTLDLLVKGDRAKLLKRWGGEMAVGGGGPGEALRFAGVRRQSATAKMDDVPAVRAVLERILAMAPEAVKPEKLFLVWNAADWIYRRQTPEDKQWSLEQLMEADLQDMKKRWYLGPIITGVTD